MQYCLRHLSSSQRVGGGTDSPGSLCIVEDSLESFVRIDSDGQNILAHVVGDSHLCWRGAKYEAAKCLFA